MMENAQNSKSVLFPQVVASQVQADGAVIELHIPADLSYLDGHFERIAVVPGVVQIQWAVHYARQYLGLSETFSHMDAIKFKELMLPKQLLKLELTMRRQPLKLEFRYHANGGEFSSGRIYFHEQCL